MTPEDMAVALTRIEGKVDVANESNVRIEKQVSVTNGRVTRIELWKAKIMGAWFVVSIAGPVIAALIVKYVG